MSAMTATIKLNRNLGKGTGWDHHTQEEKGKILTLKDATRVPATHVAELEHFSQEQGLCVHAQATIVRSHTELSQQTGIGASLALKCSLGMVSNVDAEASLAMDWSATSSTDSLLVTLRCEVAFQKEVCEFTIDEGIYREYTGASFAEVFGNAYVSGLYQGGLFQAYLLRTKADNESKEDMEAKVNLICGRVGTSVEAKAEFNTKMRHAFSMENTKFYLFAEGLSGQISMDFDKLLTQFAEYPERVRRTPFTYAVSIQPYTALGPIFQWKKFQDHRPEEPFTINNRVNEASLSTTYRLLKYRDAIVDMIGNPERYAWDRPGDCSISHADQKQLQTIAQRFIDEIDSVKHAIARREKIGILKLPFELYHPYKSLPVLTGREVVDSGYQDGNWSTMPVGEVTFHKRFLEPPAVTLTMQAKRSNFLYVGMVDTVTEKGFTMYKKDINGEGNEVHDAGDGFYWIAVGRI